MKTVLLLICLVPVFAYAQQPSITVGELLNAGGHKLTTEELRKTVVDRTVSGVVPASPHRQAVMTYKSDGSATGNSSGQGGDYGLDGTWTISDNAYFCLKLKRSTSGDASTCNFYFVLNDRIYATQKEVKSATAYLRDIKR